MIHQENAQINPERATRLRRLVAIASVALGQEAVNGIFRETYGRSHDMWQIHVNNVKDGTYHAGSYEAQVVINSYDRLILAVRQATIAYIQQL